MKILPLLGWGLLLAWTVNFINGFGRIRTIGRYGMPRALLAPNGRTYADGSMIDPLTMATIRANNQEETMLVVLAVLACMFGFLVYTMWSYMAARRRYEKRV